MSCVKYCLYLYIVKKIEIKVFLHVLKWFLSISYEQNKCILTASSDFFCLFDHKVSTNMWLIYKKQNISINECNDKEGKI